MYRLSFITHCPQAHRTPSLGSAKHSRRTRPPARTSESNIFKKQVLLRRHFSFLAFAGVFARVDLRLFGWRLLVVVVIVVTLRSLLTDSLRSSSLLLAATTLSSRGRRIRRISSLATGSLALCGAASRSRRVGAGSLGGGRQCSKLFIVVLTR